MPIRITYLSAPQSSNEDSTQIQEESQTSSWSFSSLFSNFIGGNSEANRVQKSNSAHNLLMNNLRCAVCLSLFTHPVVLSCSHSFCKVCAEKWFSVQRNGRRMQTCPLCKSRVVLYMKSTTLNNIVDEFKETLEKPKETEQNAAAGDSQKGEQQDQLTESTVQSSRRSRSLTDYLSSIWPSSFTTSVTNNPPRNSLFESPSHRYQGQRSFASRRPMSITSATRNSLFRTRTSVIRSRTAAVF